jgi:hypothetical protein
MEFSTSTLAIAVALAAITQKVTAFNCTVNRYGVQDYGYCCVGINAGWGQNCLHFYFVFIGLDFQTSKTITG